MKRSSAKILPLLGTGLLAACSSTDGTTVLVSPSMTESLADGSFTDSYNVQASVRGSGNDLDFVGADFTLSGIDGSDDVNLTIDGETYRIALNSVTDNRTFWVSSHDTPIGDDVNVFLSLMNISQNDQVRLLYMSQGHGTPLWRIQTPVGIKTQSAVVDGLLDLGGTAEYAGFTIFDLLTEDSDTRWHSLSGDAGFTVNFDDGTVEGNLTVSSFRIFGSTNLAADDAVITLGSGTIEDGVFTLNGTANAEDLGLETLNSFVVDGTFYEDGGTGLGGTITGSATHGTGDDAVAFTINGAFAASSDPIDDIGF